VRDFNSAYDPCGSMPPRNVRSGARCGGDFGAIPSVVIDQQRRASVWSSTLWCEACHRHDRFRGRPTRPMMR
jgi:hypothetical protein